MNSFTVTKPVTQTATHTRRLLVCLVLAGFAALAPAADPPPTASPPTSTPAPTGDFTRKLGDLQRDALRITPGTAGADAVTTLFADTFRQLGLFPAATAAQEVVTQEDLKHLQAVATRHPAQRRDILRTLDHWMFLLEQSGQDDVRVRATLTLLRGYAVRLEVDESTGLPLRQIRKAVAARDSQALAALFEGRSRLALTCFTNYPAVSTPKSTQS